METKILKIKKVDFDYEIKESFIGGLVLDGWMVKSIRSKKISASDGVYVKIVDGEAWMIGVHMTPVTNGNTLSAEKKTTSIKLLLTKREINKIISYQNEKGYTTVLKSLFWKGHLVKAEICLVKGKKLHDKRQTEKERDSKREADRSMKNIFN
jgi:SsrA-binding protein